MFHYKLVTSKPTTTMSTFCSCGVRYGMETIYQIRHFGRNIHQFIRHNDDFLYLFFGNKLLHFLAFESQLLDFLARRVGGDDDVAAEFAVHLHQKFDGVLHQIGVVKHRPWLIGQRATVRSVQAGGQIFGQMYAEGVQQIEERTNNNARGRVSHLGGFITENHEREIAV